VLALYTRSVALSLSLGIVLALLILNEFSVAQSIEALFDLVVTLFTEPWIVKTLAFALLVGSVMALIEHSGGVGGFVEYVQNKKAIVTSQKSALMLSYVIGIVIFIESSITALISGAVGRAFVKQYHIPPAKLALVCDSTSAPICSLIAINGWGALLLGLITTQISLQLLDVDAMELLIDALLYNFYAQSALVVTFCFIYFNLEIGAMREATSATTYQSELSSPKTASALYMFLPIVSMVVLVFVFLYISGDGEILQGSGSSAIFYTLVTTLLLMLVYYVGSANMSIWTWSGVALRGAYKLVPIAFILLLAFAIGHVTGELKSGLYLASVLSDTLDARFLAATLFILSAIMAFSTGTSWGTFSIMLPVAIPLAVGVDADIALCIGAVISGAVFGDHCSPISDTTIISSLASGCEVVEHVKTQLPYALISASIAALAFVVVGYVS